MKSVKEMVKEEMSKQIARGMRAEILSENVKNVYEANKLVKQFTKENSPKLEKAKKALKLAESKLNEFFEEEWEIEYGPEEMEIDGESIEVDNSPLYDSLLCIMECSKELYMNIDMDTEIDPMVVSKIQQAEALIRTASEMFKMASTEAKELENDELSDEYIESGDEYEEYDGEDDFDDDMDDDDCFDCDDDESF